MKDGGYGQTHPLADVFHIAQSTLTNSGPHIAIPFRIRTLFDIQTKGITF